MSKSVRPLSDDELESSFYQSDNEQDIDPTKHPVTIGTDGVAHPNITFHHCKDCRHWKAQWPKLAKNKKGTNLLQTCDGAHDIKSNGECEIMGFQKKV